MPKTIKKRSNFYKSSYLVYATFIIFIVLQAYFFIPSIRNNKWLSNSSTEKTQFQNQNDKKSIEQKMLGVHLIENDLEKKGWELTAEEASGSKEEQWVLKKVKVQFYSEDESNFSVTGEVGEVDGQTKNMTIRGHVVTESNNGYRFETDELNYQANIKKLYSLGSVNMTGPHDKNGKGLFLKGQGLEIFIMENKIKILNQVEAQKSIDKKKFNLTSQSSEFSSKNREALFAGNVKITYDTMNLTAPFAEFKYSSKKDVLEKFTLYDNVELRDQNKIGTCQELIANLIEDTMIMNGQPKVRMDEDEIQGDQIIFSEKGKKVKISHMKLERKSSK